MPSRIDVINKILTADNYPDYRLKQILTGIYQQHYKTWEEMSFLPKELRAELSSQMGEQISTLKVITSTEGDQANKVLFETTDNFRIEAVLMSFHKGEGDEDDFQSLCLSSQSGCALGCKFCATGSIGFKKNLSADEISDQILYFLQEGKTVNNVAFMGMGEPFMNPNIFDALKIITGKDKMAFSQRRISISTVGIIPGIQRLEKEFPDINLVFSLHSPFPEQRLQLMPITQKYPINEVMAVLDQRVLQTNKKVFIAYVLLGGVNDSVDHATALVKLIKKQKHKNYLYHVNLIRYNPSPDSPPFKEPDPEQVRAFQKVITQSGISNTVKQRFGRKYYSACGQLYGKYGKQTNS